MYNYRPKRRENEENKIFWSAKNFLNVKKDTNVKVWKAQQIPSSINTKKTTGKLLKTKSNGTIVNSTREKWHITFRKQRFKNSRHHLWNYGGHKIVEALFYVHSKCWKIKTANPEFYTQWKYPSRIRWNKSTVRQKEKNS